MASTGRIFVGNILFVVCCAFYLAWWLLSFRPSKPTNGFTFGWLLLPAVVAGVAGVVGVIWGMADADASRRPIANWWFIVGAVAAYIIFTVVTRWAFDRQVTSELILFTGWAALALAEANTLYGSGLFPRGAALAFVVVIGLVLIASLVCYVLYYRLDAVAGYVDGIIPLALVALVMAGFSVCMAALSS